MKRAYSECMRAALATAERERDEARRRLKKAERRVEELFFANAAVPSDHPYRAQLAQVMAERDKLKIECDEGRRRLAEMMVAAIDAAMKSTT